jgi:hypothetical protein
MGKAAFHFLAATAYSVFGFWCVYAGWCQRGDLSNLCLCIAGLLAGAAMSVAHDALFYVNLYCCCKRKTLPVFVPND